MFRTTISDQDRDLVMMVRELVQNKIAPRAVEWDSRGGETFDWTAVDLLAEQNLLAPSAPEEYGGRGLSHLSTAMILEEIAAGCGGVATSVAANLHAISPLLMSGTEEQRLEFIPLLTRKKAKLGAIPLMDNKPNLDIITHSEMVDIRDSSLSGEPGQDHQVVNGFKEYVMNGQTASFVTTMFSSAPDGAKKNLQVVLLPMKTPGLKLAKPRKKFGLRYCSASELIFEDVAIDNKYLIGKPGSGFLIFMQGLERMTPYIGAIAVGISRAIYELALESSKMRFVNGKPFFEESSVSYVLTDMATKLNAARLSVHLACWMIDNEMDSSQASSKAKIISNRYAQDITKSAMEIIGGRAYLKGFVAEKCLRDAKTLSLIDGSELFHKHLIAGQL
ncbi:MAG: acyl-CoA dehydrogenase family protein [Bacillota bacterium]|nr:acyl-CoA dehydrogenase family protein [Bacillota bacterium]